MPVTSGADADALSEHAATVRALAALRDRVDNLKPELALQVDRYNIDRSLEPIDDARIMGVGCWKRGESPPDSWMS